MIRKKTLPEQQELWVARDRIKIPKGSCFYDRLAADLDEQGFGDRIRELCEPYYHGGSGGRPPIDPEVSFKIQIVGFFEKLASDRGIAARGEDSLSIRRFLRYDLEEAIPDHSSLSVIRKRLPLEVHEEAFSFSLRPLREAGLLPGENIGVDSSTMEANASLEKLTRREDGKTYREYVGELAAEAEGIDPENLAAMVEYTASQVDGEDGSEDRGDKGDGPGGPDERRKPTAGADKGCHKKEELAKLVKAGFEPNIAEPAGRTVPERNESQAAAFEANRKNRKSATGRELMRRRGEKVERSFRHLLDHGGGRRTTLSGHVKIAKRLLVQALAFNLSIHSWHVHGVGTVKQYAAGNLNQEVVSALAGGLCGLVTAVGRIGVVLRRFVRPNPTRNDRPRPALRQPAFPRHQPLPA